MKRIKKMIALVIAASMIIGTMSMATFAADGDPVITVSGLEDVKQVDFYQVLKWTGSDQPQPAEGTSYGGWSFASPFTKAGLINPDTDSEFATDKDAIKYILGDPGAQTPIAMQLTAEIAGVLADQATSGAKAGTLSADKTSASLTIDGTNNTLGMYMALITTNDASEFVYNPVFVSADFKDADSWVVTSDKSYSNNAAAKKSKEFVKKEASSTSTSYNVDTVEDDGLSWKSTRPGEKVDFTVTTSIPGYGPVYQHPHFVIKDELTDMTLDPGTVALTKPAGLTGTTGTPNVLSEDYDYYIEETTGGYTITFTEKYLKTVNAPKDVEITYTATVSTTAPLNVNLEENEVWIEFSHDPQHEDSYEYEKDDTNHYTFTIDANAIFGMENEVGKSGSEIIKVGVDASGKPITSERATSAISSTNYVEGPLAGATFKLYKADPTSGSDPTDVTSATQGEEYTDVDGNTLSLESDAQGRIKIQGLDAGTYFLEEVSAPTGYIKSQDPVRIDIVPEYGSKEVTKWTGGNDWVDEEDADHPHSVTYEVDVLKKYTVYVNGVAGAEHVFEHDGGKNSTWIKESSRELPSSIINTKGVELPSTGGRGTTLFYVIGTILVLGAGVLLVTRRRVKAG